MAVEGHSRATAVLAQRARRTEHRIAVAGELHTGPAAVRRSLAVEEGIGQAEESHTGLAGERRSLAGAAGNLAGEEVPNDPAEGHRSPGADSLVEGTGSALGAVDCSLVVVVVVVEDMRVDDGGAVVGADCIQVAESLLWRRSASAKC